MFDDLFALVLGHGFTVPPQIGAAFRAMAAVEGTVSTIDPDFDLVAAAQEHRNRLMKGRFITATLFPAKIPLSELP